MGYLFTVLTILNVAAILAMVWLVLGNFAALPGMVETAISEEVRKQDDRIEIRLSRAAGQAEESPETSRDGIMPRLMAGRPTRRN